MNNFIPLGVSACLLGNQVRFDGGHKHAAFCTQELAEYVRFYPVCPEVGIGLPVPRPALRLVRTEGRIVLRMSNDSTIDLTDAMAQYSQQSIQSLHGLCGYIVCAKSPSCGMERVKVYSEDGKSTTKSGVGLFTAELQRQMPWLPIEEDGRLNDPVLRENFVARIFALYEFNQLWQQGLSRGELIAFHSRYKLLLLAHSQPLYRELGRFVAEIDKWDSLDEYAAEYRLRLMSLMSQRATRRNHTNVLMHVQGYFTRHLNSARRQELAQLILNYRQGTQPLLAPITLIKHYLAEYPDPYLAEQRYFSPYPDALRLRYGH